ncbi:MAG TPA: hypothetical protein VFH43_00845 [Candidatus Kapabacteria bacterium]|nr:hypothetical protein [Candidatus Kapabacteria bacterium]
MSHTGTPLTAIPQLSTGALTRLQEIWVTTAEQLVATAATPGGLKSLADHLGVTEERMTEILEAAKKSLSSDTITQLEKPIDVSEYGLGANKPAPDDDK